MILGLYFFTASCFPGPPTRKQAQPSLLALSAKRKMQSGLQLVNSICGAVLQDMGIDDEDFLNIVKDIAAEEKKLLAHPLFQVCAMLLLLTIVFFNLRKS